MDCGTIFDPKTLWPVDSLCDQVHLMHDHVNHFVTPSGDMRGGRAAVGATDTAGHWDGQG